MRAAIRAGALATLVLSSLSVTQTALAGPSAYVITPIVEEGEREIDFKAGLLFGLTQGAPHNSVRMQAEYEF